MQKSVLGIAGYSGSGKTTLIEKLIPRFTAAGLTVSLIKHAHHGFDIDRPGKDSHRHRQAGAGEVLVTSNERWALMHELRGAPEPGLEALLARLSPCDLVLVEGYRSAAIAKLEVHRPSLGQALLPAQAQNVVAVAADGAVDTALPVLDLNQPGAIAEFIMTHLHLVQQ